MSRTYTPSTTVADTVCEVQMLKEVVVVKCLLLPPILDLSVVLLALDRLRFRVQRRGTVGRYSFLKKGCELERDGLLLSVDVVIETKD